ncbi:MAG: DUF3124 domain-containing protein [Pseudomonadota bacterium]
MIRNVDPATSITINSIKFYNPLGQLEVSFPAAPVTLSPLETTTVSTKNMSLYPAEGGRPFFIVEWQTEKKAIPPIIESARIMLRPDGYGPEYLAISITPGKVIDEKDDGKGDEEDSKGGKGKK